MDQQSHSKTMPVVVLTPGFQVEGTLHVMGQMQTYLNDDTKPVLVLSDATLYGLAVGNPAASIHVDEVFLRKTECHVVLIRESVSREDSGLLPRAEPLAVYTTHYVIQGKFHMGTDSLLADHFEISRAMLVGATDVSIFPLFQPQVAMLQQAPLAYVSRRLVHTHHRV